MDDSSYSFSTGSIFIKERWITEINAEGEVKASIEVFFKNQAKIPQKISCDYEYLFPRSENKPAHFISLNKQVIVEGPSFKIPLNEILEPKGIFKLEIDAIFQGTAHYDGLWWDVSLPLKYGILSPHELIMECYLPMDAEEIKNRSKHQNQEVNESDKKIDLVFTNSPFFLKIAYKLKKSIDITHKEVEPSTDSSKDKLNREDIEAIRNKMPIINYLKNKLSKSGNKPFSDKNFLIILHFLKDLIIFLEACEELGLEPEKSYLFYKPYLYPHKDIIIDCLKNKKKYNVYPLEHLDEFLRNKKDELHDILILEDGGYIVPKIHGTIPSLHKSVIGAVEQTTKGIENDKEIKKFLFCIMNVAEANMKSDIEPRHVANAIVKNIEKLLPERILGNEQIAIMGFGTIGSEVAHKYKSNDFKVTIYDPKSERRSKANQQNYIVEENPEKAVKDKHLVIGSSGRTSIGLKEILEISNNTCLVSTSSDQIEIDIDTLKNLSKKRDGDISINKETREKIGTDYVIRNKNTLIHLLADGYPINFWCSDSMPNEISDFVLSMILISCFELVINKSQIEIGIKDINSLVEKYEIAELFERYHRK